MQNADDIMEMDLESLFGIQSDDEESVEANESANESNETQNNNVETSVDSKPTTKAVSERINKVRKSTELETRESVAKELGYESYEAMMADKAKKREKKLFDDAGVEENDETKEFIEKIVKSRIENDPRFKKLKEYEELEKARFVKSQIDEINKLSGSNYTSIDQFSEETLKIWKVTGNLKQAYLATNGEKLILGKSSQKGSLDHLANPNPGTSSKTRYMTESEKAFYRSIVPDITEDELNSKTIEE